jgi:hypothetical protein
LAAHFIYFSSVEINGMTFLIVSSRLFSSAPPLTNFFAMSPQMAHRVIRCIAEAAVAIGGIADKWPSAARIARALMIHRVIRRFVSDI